MAQQEHQATPELNVDPCPPYRSLQNFFNLRAMSMGLRHIKMYNQPMS